MFSIRLAVCLFAISSLIAFASCTTRSAPNENGVVHVTSPIPDKSHDESKFPEGVVVTHGDPDVSHWARVRYNNGDEVDILFGLGEGRGLSTGDAFEAACKNYANCPYAKYQLRYYGIVPMDGQDWMDTNLWMLVGFDSYTDSDKIKYQACRGGKFYSASDLETLMDVLDKLDDDATAASSDPEVKKHLLSEDSLERHMPVCHWRHRVALDVAYPVKPGSAHVRIVPASHTHAKYVEIRDDKGNGVEVYVDEGEKRIEKFVFVSAKASATLRPIYEGNDCPTLERCEHFAYGPAQKPDRFDMRSVDGEPLFNSRVFEVNDTLDGIKVYDGCAGGRLYSGKNRDQVEREVQEAIANPAPPTKKESPVFGAPETSESGDTVIPDSFCDWAFRRHQIEAMKNAQAGH